MKRRKYKSSRIINQKIRISEFYWKKSIFMKWRKIEIIDNIKRFSDKIWIIV
jgi:hypothetical protein